MECSECEHLSRRLGLASAEYSVARDAERAAESDPEANAGLLREVTAKAQRRYVHLLAEQAEHQRTHP